LAGGRKPERGEMPALRHIALASCPVAVLAACTSSPPQAGRVADARPVPAASAASALAQAACPAGRLLPDGGRIEIDWVDFLASGGRQYIAGLTPDVTIGPSQLGPVITHIRCSLAARDDHRHTDIPLVDGSAACLPAGTAVYEVRGYSPRCRLAGYVNGQLRVYLAQRDLHGHSAPVSCALPMPAR
jgi:hypothetical protein